MYHKHYERYRILFLLQPDFKESKNHSVSMSCSSLNYVCLWRGYSALLLVMNYTNDGVTWLSMPYIVLLRMWLKELIYFIFSIPATFQSPEGRHIMKEGWCPKHVCTNTMYTCHNAWWYKSTYAIFNFFFLFLYTLNLKTFFEELKLSDSWGHRFMELQTWGYCSKNTEYYCKVTL